jgi:inward rectifier potassium channel
LYGRFSRPTAKIVFSENLLIAPYGAGQGLMFRMGNARKSELIETDVQVILAMNQQEEDGTTVRKFYGLPLEISKISFFSLSWTVVHDINTESPILGFSKEDLQEANAEILVLVKGTDEANQQLVHARRSYVAADFVWNARFQPVITRNQKGLPHVLVRRLGNYEQLP